MAGLPSAEKHRICCWAQVYRCFQHAPAASCQWSREPCRWLLNGVDQHVAWCCEDPWPSGSRCSSQTAAAIVAAPLVQEDNFDEAVRAAFHAWTPPSIRESPQHSTQHSTCTCTMSRSRCFTRCSIEHPGPGFLVLARQHVCATDWSPTYMGEDGFACHNFAAELQYSTRTHTAEGPALV